MHSGFEDIPDSHERRAAFYAKRASGGVGLIVTGAFMPSETCLCESATPLFRQQEQVKPSDNHRRSSWIRWRNLSANSTYQALFTPRKPDFSFAT